MSHEHRHSAGIRPLAVALALIVGLMAGEVVFGIVAGSLALLADAGHMLTDAAALGLALGAAAVAGRPARGRWTFGFRRLEILAAHLNGIALVVVGVVIVYTAVRRLVDPPDVRGGLVLVVALAGVAVNLVATALLARTSRESLNVRGVFLHVVTDLAAFAGTALAGALVLATGWDRFDPIAGLVVVHDLHVWTVTSSFPALAAHVLVEPGADCHGVRRRLERLLADRFGLRHTTLQVDHATGPRQPVELGEPYRRETPV